MSDLTTYSDFLAYLDSSAEKGYGDKWEDYTPSESFLLQIPSHLYAQLRDLCTPFSLGHLETCGAFIGVWEPYDHTRDIQVCLVTSIIDCGEGAFHHPAACYPSPDYTRRVMAAQDDTDKFIAFWHLHPGIWDGLYLSKGDIATVLESPDYSDNSGIQGLMGLVYADNKKFELGIFGIAKDVVYRYSVEVL